MHVEVHSSGNKSLWPHACHCFPVTEWLCHASDSECSSVLGLLSSPLGISAPNLRLEYVLCTHLVACKSLKHLRLQHQRPV